MTDKPPPGTEFVCLQSAQDCQCGCGIPGYRNRFFTTWKDDGHDYTKLADGTVAYEIIGYADTVENAQRILYGRR